LPAVSCLKAREMATTQDSILRPARAHTEGDFAREEVSLANRNAGMPLEALRYDVTPSGLHFRLVHFDVPFVVSELDWRLDISGRVRHPLNLSLAQIRKFPNKTLRVTLECAGNGRVNVAPRWQTQPWEYGAVGTAEWSGTSLCHVLERAGLEADAVDVAFFGADRGVDAGREQDYGRSLTPALATRDDVLLVWEMNGQPLPPQHGFPLRLIVPGWYGMASVKWLNRIEVLARPFDGYQQVDNYVYRRERNDVGVPVSTLRVRSLMVPPGIPDWYARNRTVEAGPLELIGRAWSGGGVPVVKVMVSIDGIWSDAILDPSQQSYAWRAWRFPWHATAGEHTLACRATNAEGETQPLDPPWDYFGFGNNAVQRVRVTVRG
jgi:DMSO/TMAO reductase YedYZ molybdopterin-dependent catalytic subunit